MKCNQVGRFTYGQRPKLYFVNRQLNFQRIAKYTDGTQIRKLFCIQPKYDVVTSQPGQEYSRAEQVVDEGVYNPLRDVQSIQNLKLFRKNKSKELLRFIIPGLAIPISDQIMGLIDTICIGQFASTMELAALGPANSLFIFSTYVFYSLSVATSTIVSEMIRNRQFQNARKFVGYILQVALFIGIIIALLLLNGGHLYTKSVIKSSAVLLATDTYLNIRLLSQPAAMLTMVMQATFLAQRDAITPCIAIVTQASLNLVLDVLSVAVFGYGIAGAAWATVVSQWFGCLLLFAGLSLGGREKLVNWTSQKLKQISKLVVPPVLLKYNQSDKGMKCKHSTEERLSSAHGCTSVDGRNQVAESSDSAISAHDSDNSRSFSTGSFDDGGHIGYQGSLAPQCSGTSVSNASDSLNQQAQSVSNGTLQYSSDRQQCQVNQRSALNDNGSAQSTEHGTSTKLSLIPEYRPLNVDTLLQLWKSLGPLSAVTACKNLIYFMVASYAGHLAPIQLAAHQVALAAYMLISFCSNPLENAALVYVPREKTHDLQLEVMKILLKMAAFQGVFGALVAVMCLCVIPGAFTPDAATWPYMAKIATPCFCVLVMVSLDNVCAGILYGRKRFASIARAFVNTLVVSCAYIVTAKHVWPGILGVWYAYLVFFVMRLSQSSYIVYSMVRKEKTNRRIVTA